MTPSAADNDAGQPPMGRHDLAELAMLADGSLPPARRAEAEARITATPEGSALLANERRAVEAMRALASEPAPASLRERIAADRARAEATPRRGGAGRRIFAAGRSFGLRGGALAGAVAVLAVALVLVLTGGQGGAPSVTQAASLALRGTTSLSPPPAQGAHSDKLTRNVEDVYFPTRLGTAWTASGERIDQLDGRVARTIYYGNNRGEQIAYTIVAGPALAQPARAVLSHENNIDLRSIALGGRTVVTWRRAGHTCILSGARVSDAVLLDLAAWNASV